MHPGWSRFCNDYYWALASYFQDSNYRLRALFKTMTCEAGSELPLTEEPCTAQGDVYQHVSY